MFLLLTLISYSFPIGMHLSYDVNVEFEGYLPVLRGRQSLANLAMTVDVVGLTPDADGNPRIVSEIKALKLKFNGAVMPFGPENVNTFFPKTTIEASLLGKLLKTDAPNISLPVRLPGLDVKRFPDITYLPIEFPKEGIEEGKPFKFKKLFGDGPVEYEVTPTKIRSDAVSLTLKLSQSYVTFEDDRKSPTDEANAAMRIETELKGTGTATFDVKRGLITEFNIEAVSSGQAIDLKTKSQVERKLKTTLKVVLSAQ